MAERQQLWHRTKRTPAKIEVEAAANHPKAVLNKTVANFNNFRTKELNFVDSYDLSILIEQTQYFLGAPDRKSRHTICVMRFNMDFVIACIHKGFKNCTF